MRAKTALTTSLVYFLSLILLSLWIGESHAVAVPQDPEGTTEDANEDANEGGFLYEIASGESTNYARSDNALPEVVAGAFDTPYLTKRRGGGGRGGGGSKGGGKTGGTSGGSPGSTSGTSNTGGRTSSGSGVPPGYRSTAGNVYAGGSSVPYRAGLASPRGLAPGGLLLGGGLGFWIGSSWGLYGAYPYRFPANITFYNATEKKNDTLPGVCLCSRYQECSCETVQGDQTFYTSLLGDGTYSTLNNKRSTVQVDNVNGTRTIVVNGTLANGTTAAGFAGLGKKGMLEGASWGIIAVGIGCMVLAL